MNEGNAEKHFGIAIAANSGTGDITAFTLKETYATYADVSKFDSSNEKNVSATIDMTSATSSLTFDFGDGTKIFGNLDRVSTQGTKSKIDFKGTGNWEIQRT